MANESLVISISADQKAALAGLKQLNDQLLQLEKALKKTSDTASIIKLQDQIRDLKSEMSSLNEVAQGKLVKGTNQAANALTNLGRVAQDAPYGFIGIQNNLNPLLESFQRLKAETGGTGTALKALGAGLMGPAGLGIALSVGSALLVTFGDKLFKSGKAAEKSAQEVSDYAKAVKETNKAVGDELVTARLLVDAAKDTSLSMTTRVKAIKELRSEYPDLLAKYTDENILMGQAKGLYGEIANGIMKVAKAKAIAAKVSELETQRLDAEFNKLKINAVTAKEIASAKPTRQIALGGGGFAQGTGQGLVSTTLEEQNKIILRKNKALSVQDNILKNISATQEFLLKQADKTAMVQALTTKEVVKQAAATKFKATPLDNYLATANVVNKSGFKPVDTSLVSIPYTGNTGVKSLENLTLGNSLLMQREQLILANYNADVLFNQQQAMANELTTIGTSLFTSMGNALLYGQDMGEALTNTLKKIVMDLTAAIAKALIFNALMAAFTGGGSVVGSGVLGGIGASVANSQGGGSGFFGFLSGNNILMGQNRTRTSMGLRRG
jgi:hypothetical protein